MEFCFSATVAVNDNSTLRASACALLDSYAALSLTDSVLRQDELETPVWPFTLCAMVAVLDKLSKRSCDVSWEHSFCRLKAT
jgi:hypothetical protein